MQSGLLYILLPVLVVLLLQSVLVSAHTHQHSETDKESTTSWLFRGSHRHRDLVEDAASSTSAQNGALLVDEDSLNIVNNNDKDTYRAIYKGRFQYLVDGCSGPPPVLEASCVGNITFLSASHASITCESATPKQETFDNNNNNNNNNAFLTGNNAKKSASSTLLCQSNCQEDSDGNDACTKVYWNDGSYSTQDGPWGEIMYQCEGPSIDDVGSTFAYQDGGSASCSWRLFFGNQIFHLAQLGVFCDADATTTATTTTTANTTTSTNATMMDDINATLAAMLNGTLLFDDPEATTFIPSSTISVTEGDFVYDDAYFECSLGDGAAVDFEGPENDQVLCAVGQNCNGDECTVDLHTIQVRADVHQFWDQGCVAFPASYLSSMITSSASSEREAADTIHTTVGGINTITNNTNSTADKEIMTDDPPIFVLEDPFQNDWDELEALPLGNYTMEFRVGWSLLFKNPDFWYNYFPDSCMPQQDPVVVITCQDDGAAIQFIRSSSASIQCVSTSVGTLECTESLEHFAELVNDFVRVVYECTSSSQLPETKISYPPAIVACNEGFDELFVVGHALQIGHYCKNSAGGKYLYDDYYYECGPSNQYLYLSASTESLGDRFTCLSTVPVGAKNDPVIVPYVSMRTDWRYYYDDNKDASGPDPMCYTYQEVPRNSTAMLPYNDTSLEAVLAAESNNTSSP